jgi:hypothetical protein
MSILASIRAFTEHDGMRMLGRNGQDNVVAPASSAQHALNELVLRQTQNDFVDKKQGFQTIGSNIQSASALSEYRVKFPNFFQEQQHKLRKPQSFEQEDPVTLSKNTLSGASIGRNSSLFQPVNDFNRRDELDKSIRDTNRTTFLHIAKQGYSEAKTFLSHEIQNVEINPIMETKIHAGFRTTRAKASIRPLSANAIPRSDSRKANRFEDGFEGSNDRSNSSTVITPKTSNDRTRIDVIISNIEELTRPCEPQDRDFSRDPKHLPQNGNKAISRSLEARILKFEKTIENEGNPLKANTAKSKCKSQNAIDSVSKLGFMTSSSKLQSAASLHKRMGSERDTLYSERGRTRYGPYKARDVHSFIDFLDRLDGATNGFVEGRPASDLRTYPVELVLNQPEILRKPAMARELIRVSGTNNSIVTVLDLLSLLFPHASSAEKQRMRSLTIARRAFSQFVAMLSLPNNTKNEGFDLNDFSSVFDKAGDISSSVPQGKNYGFSSRPNSTNTPAKAKPQALKASWRETLDGWSVGREFLMKLKKELDLLYDIETGTITGNDVLEIFKWHPRLKGVSTFQSTEMYVKSLGYTLQDEFNGVMLVDLLTSGFRLTVVEK